MFAGALLCSNAFFNISRVLLSAFSSLINAPTSLLTPFTSSLNLLANWSIWMVRLTSPTMHAARLNGSPNARRPRDVDDLVSRTESDGLFCGETHSLIQNITHTDSRFGGGLWLAALAALANAPPPLSILVISCTYMQYAVVSPNSQWQLHGNEMMNSRQCGRM
jgi:hypothetical protein